MLYYSRDRDEIFARGQGLTVVDRFWCLNVYHGHPLHTGVQTPVDVFAFSSQVRVAADPNHLRQV